MGHLHWSLRPNRDRSVSAGDLSDGNGLYEHCRDPQDSRQKLVCAAYVRGMVDGLLAIRDTLSRIWPRLVWVASRPQIESSEQICES
jgi:hypothetical protein